MKEPVILQAVFNKASTTIDGGWRITFDTGEHMATQVTDVAKLKDERLYVLVFTEEAFEASRRQD